MIVVTSVMITSDEGVISIMTEQKQVLEEVVGGNIKRV